MAAPLHVHQPEAADARSLSDRAYYRIRELIVSLALPPGSILNERELMRELGLGRTPVREALRTLAREQLVEVYPRRGHLRLRASTSGDLAGLSEVRLALETAAARLAAEHATAEDRARCSELLEELERAADERDERGADRARPADPPPRLRLHAQRVSRAHARGVLHPHAPHLVPRTRPGRAARGRRPRAPRASRRHPRRRPQASGGRDEAPRHRLRARDQRGLVSRASAGIGSPARLIYQIRRSA